jgi:uncharacterized protein (TIGR03437 family)
MNKTSIRAAQVSVIGAALPILLFAFPDGPPPGVTGAPGEGTCTLCHFGGGGGGSVEVALPETMTYSPGVKQQWTVTVSDSDAAVYGFELSVRTGANNRQAGRLDPAQGESNIRVICSNAGVRPANGCPSGSPIEYIQHSRPRQANTFRIEWTPPAEADGPVRIYVAANAANGNGLNTGDDIYTAQYTLLPQASPPAGAPKFPSAGVVSAATFAPGMSPGAFISIFGENLASATRTWDGAIQGTTLPSQLEGVSVTVGGKQTYLAFISPTQLNVLLPADDMTGSVEVKVTTPSGSWSEAAVIDRYAPGFFPSSLGGNYVAATHIDAAAVGNGQAGSRPARPGEVITLWGTGFGPTAEHVPSGQVLTAAYPLANPADLKVTIGARQAQVTFAGVTLAGVCQINVMVPPDLAAGDHQVLAEIGGARTQTNALIAVGGAASAGGAN